MTHLTEKTAQLSDDLGPPECLDVFCMVIATGVSRTAINELAIETTAEIPPAAVNQTSWQRSAGSSAFRMSMSDCLPATTYATIP